MLVLELFARWGGSSAGRASRSQCEGREFDPPPLHQKDFLFLRENRLRAGFCVYGFVFLPLVTLYLCVPTVMPFLAFLVVY